MFATELELPYSGIYSDHKCNLLQGLATRHRPSGEGLRAGVLRREESSSSINTSNITSTSSLNSSQASSNVSPKNPLGLAVNIHNRGVGPTRVQVSPAKETTLNQPQSHSPSSLSNSHSISVEGSSNSPPQPSSHSPAAPGKPHPPTPHPKPQQAGKAPMSFLAEIQAAQKRRGLEESPEGSPSQPKQSPQKLPQTNSLGGAQNGGGGENNQ